MLKAIIAPVCSLTLAMMAISYFETFLSLRLSGQHFNGLIAALIYSSYYAGMLLGGLCIEKVIQKLGQAHAFIFSAAAIAGVVSLQSFTQPTILWMGFRLLSGLLVAGLFVSVESWLLLLFPRQRGAVLAFYMIGLYTANSIGQFGISAVPMDSIHPFNLTLLFVSLSIIPICFVRKNSPGLNHSNYLSVFKLYRTAPLGFLGNLTSGLILGAFYTTGPICGKMSNFTMMQISLFMAVTIFGGMCMQWPIGKLSDIIQRKRVIILICCMIIAFSIAAIFVFSMPFGLKLVIQFLFGGMIFTLYPVCITYCCDFLPDSDITSVAAAGLVNYGMGSIFGPAIALGFLKAMGPIGFYLYIALLGLALLTFALTYRKKIQRNLF